MAGGIVNWMRIGNLWFTKLYNNSDTYIYIEREKATVAKKTFTYCKIIIISLYIWARIVTITNN